MPMPFWTWVTRPNYVTAATTVVTPTIYTSTTATNVQWYGLGNQTATTGGWYNNLTAQQAAYHNAFQNQYIAQAQQAGLAQELAAYERYAFQLYRPQMMAEHISSPAILMRQEEGARQEQVAYRRALDECNQQEAERLLRLIEQREVTEAARRQAMQAQQALAEQEVQRRRTAMDRANALLLEHLTPAQRDTFTKNGWFIVEGGRSKTKYRIHARSVAGNIDVLDRQDRVTHRLCCHARDHSIPSGDHHLSQKIMLELAEDDFLRLANRH